MDVHRDNVPAADLVPPSPPDQPVPSPSIPRPRVPRFYVAVAPESAALSWQLRAPSGAVVGCSPVPFADLTRVEESAWRVREVVRHGGGVLDADEVPSAGGWVWRVSDDNEVVAVDVGAAANHRDAINRGREFLEQASGAMVSRVVQIHRRDARQVTT